MLVKVLVRYFKMVHTKKLFTRGIYFCVGFLCAISFYKLFYTPKSLETFKSSNIFNSFVRHGKSERDLPFSYEQSGISFPYYPEQQMGVTFPEEIARFISLEEEEEEWELENENVPQLPVILGSKKDGPRGFNAHCARFPDLYVLRFSNIHWQIEETKEETYFLYSAFLDIRGNLSRHPHHPYDNSMVRVLAMSDKIRMNEGNSSLKVCQFWFENKQVPVFGKVSEVRMIWVYQWGNKGHYFPYMITCQLPAGLKDLPLSVSLVSDRCNNATNNLNIFHRNLVDNTTHIIAPPQKGIGVCVKALDYPDESQRDRLIEWIETLRLLGVDKIFFYEFFVDTRIKRVLDYYEARGIIGVTQTTLPGELPNQSQLRHLYIRGRKLDKRLTELIPYNDCFLKNMYNFRYIAVMDTDEIFMPAEEISWTELMDKVVEKDIGVKKMEKQPVTTFCFENFYFLDGMMEERLNEVSHIPPNFHMLQHVYRSANSTGRRYMKCLHSSKETMGLHNHFALFCRDGRCVRHYVNATRGQMNHYRSKCVADFKNCTAYMLETRKDTKIWRFKDELVKRVQTVLNYLSS